MSVRRRCARLRGARATLLGTLLLGPTGVPAHPMGNMGISHASELVVQARRIVLYYTLDFAEIPTFVETRKHQPDAAAGAPAAANFMQALTLQVARGLSLTLDGRRAALMPTTPCTGRFAAGAAGMPTLRVTCEFGAPVPADASTYRITYRDLNYAQRSGWKEVALRAEGDARVVASSVPTRGRSAALSAYPENASAAPPQVVEAHATIQRANASPR